MSNAVQEAKVDRRSTRNPYPIRKNYKRKKTKKQLANELKCRKRKQLEGLKANCGEDTVFQSFWLEYPDTEDTIARLEQTRDYLKPYHEKSIVLNGIKFFNNPGCLKDFTQHYRYRLTGSGIDWGITRNISKQKSPYGPPNSSTRFGPLALEFGVAHVQKCLLDAIQCLGGTIVREQISEIHTYIDVPIPFITFREYWDKGLYKGRIYDKENHYGSFGEMFTYSETTNKNRETIYINQGKGIEITIYTKQLELARNKLDVQVKRHVYERKYGAIPQILTRIEIKIKRMVLKNYQYNGIFLDTVTDWEKTKASIIKHIMTKVFWFVEKDGSPMTEWTWACEQYVTWAKEDNDKNCVISADIERKPRPATGNSLTTIQRAISTIQTIACLEESKPITTARQILAYLSKVSKDPRKASAVFGKKFQNNGLLKHTKNNIAMNNRDLVKPMPASPAPMIPEPLKAVVPNNPTMHPNTLSLWDLPIDRIAQPLS